MTTNWIEEIKSEFKISHSKEFLDEFNKKFKTPEERLLWSIFGKTDDKSPQDRLVDFITTLLEKQREEILEKIEKRKVTIFPEYLQEDYANFNDGLDEAIEIIKSHDKTS